LSINFFTLYAVYAYVCIITYIFILRVKSPETAFIGLLAGLFIPPFGLVFTLLLKRPEKPAENEAGVTKHFAVPPLIAEVEKLRVPMSEALILNDHVVCCKLLIDALKNDSTKYLFGIREALAKGDPETAHYAAAAVMDIQRDLLDRVKRLREDFQRHELGDGDLEEYVWILKKAIDSRLFDRSRQAWLQASLEEVLDYMMEVMPSPRVFSERAALAVSRSNYHEALKFAGEYLDKYPGEEDAYLYYIQCLTAMRDTVKLRDFIGNLTGSPVKLTTKTLRYIRYLKDTGTVA